MATNGILPPNFGPIPNSPTSGLPPLIIHISIDEGAKRTSAFKQQSQEWVRDELDVRTWGILSIMVGRGGCNRRLVGWDGGGGAVEKSDYGWSGLPGLIND